MIINPFKHMLSGLPEINDAISINLPLCQPVKVSYTGPGSSLFPQNLS